MHGPFYGNLSRPEFCSILQLRANQTEQAYIPIDKIIRTYKQSASTSLECNTSGNRHQPDTYGDLSLNRFL